MLRHKTKPNQTSYFDSIISLWDGWIRTDSGIKDKKTNFSQSWTENIQRKKSGDRNIHQKTNILKSII